MKKNVPFLFFVILLVLVTSAFFGLIKDYLLAIFWSITLAILFNGLHQRILKRVGGRTMLASSLTLTVILLVAIIPVLLIGQAVISQGVHYYERMETGEFNIQQQIDTWRSRLPAVESFLDRLGLDIDRLKENLNEGLSNLSKLLTGKLVDYTQNIVKFFIQFAIMLYLLFFFLKDGRDLLEKLIWVIPMGDREEWQLMKRFDSVARATVKGSLVVAIVQGTVGGLLFWAVGIKSAALWGVLMTILSLLPLGSGLVWAPAGIIFLTQGAYGKGIIVLVVGAFFIGLIDNFLRPRLVGTDTKMPDYLILVSTLGGLAWFGISGFVLGPIIAALFVTVWQMMGQQYGQSMDHAARTIESS